tara:strand:+ start:886 stop:2736 length:1851 start_codon:yes stop_codon:yes gene_type:complete
MSGYPPNTQNSDGAYVGDTYAIDSSGGFDIQQSFPEIQLQDTTIASRFDVTDALQIKYSVRRMNDRIGITKDENNDKTLFIEFDASNDMLINDTVTITSDDLLKYITTDSIISMGRLSTLYSDFNYTVLEYFGAPYGFSTLFAGEQYYNVNQGVFDPSALLQLFNKFDFNINGTLVTDLSGYFKVHGVSENLRYSSGTNIFDNRPEEKSMGVTDGFVEGDLLYISNGINITLKVDIEQEPYSPISNIGPTNLSSINNLINYTESQTNVHKLTTSTTTNITQTYSVPILIELVNYDLGAFVNYGAAWNNKSDTTIGNQNWLAVSISASGKYQTAIEEYGDIYTSKNFGTTWTSSQNIGTALTNSISISLSGQYQTAANGKDIYVSSNYGITWTKVYNFGTTHIFVTMSLTGQYQSVISSGDGIYQSSNYGQTWTKNTNINGDLYNSIQSFPTAGMSMSYDGKRQVIVCEAIYLSTNYGQTWNTTTIINDTNSEFDDHNWVGCDMSSDGQYMAAIEVTGEVYISSDFGNNWTKIDNANVQDKQWQAISISASGRFLTAVEKNGYVYVSTDFGSNWKRSPDPKLSSQVWQAISVSANGMYQTAVVYGGHIYASEIYELY